MNDSKPIVSVIVPIYNAERYLEECLESIQGQTLRDIEVLCMDDGSTDESLAIERRFEQRDIRFRVIERNHEGAAAARNAGLQAAQGEYVVFFDCDDFFDPETLERAVCNAQRNHSDVVLFGGRFFDTQKQSYTTDEACLTVELLPETESFTWQDVPQNLFQIINPAPWTKLVRKGFLDDTGILFQVIPNTNDLYFSYAILVEANRISAENASFVSYRVAAGTSTQDRKKRDPLCFLEAMQKLWSLICEKGRENLLGESFQKMVLSNTAYNLRTVNDVSAQAAIVNALRSDDFSSLRKQFSAPLANDQMEGYRNYVLGIVENLHGRSAARCFTSFPSLLASRASDTTPLVSVVIPVYNAEAFVGQTIDSVVGQTLQNIEIICIDDGSTDDSLSVLLQYAKRDPRISVYTQGNSGLSHTRNLGIEKAHGTYIYFLDSDDLIKPSALEELAAQAEQEELDLLFFDADSFYESDELETKFSSYKEYYHRKKGYQGVLNGPALASQMYKNGDYLPSACLYLMRLEFLKNEGVRFVEGIVHEDNAFTFACMMKARRAAHNPLRAYLRRVREGSTMTSKKTMHHAYGYYACWKSMSAILFERAGELPYEDEEAMTSLVAAALDSSRKSFAGISGNKYDYNVVPLKDRAAFKVNVAENVIREKKLSSDNKKLKKRIDSLKNSRSFKAARAISAPLRAAKKIIRK